MLPVDVRLTPLPIFCALFSCELLLPAPSAGEDQGEGDTLRPSPDILEFIP